VAHNHRRSSCHRSVWHLAGDNVGSPGTTLSVMEQHHDREQPEGERVSESKRHGIVSCNPAVLLTRGRPRTCGCVGPPHRAVHGDHQTRRSYEPDPSLTLGISSELGQTSHPSVIRPRRRPARSAEGQPAHGVKPTIVDQANARSNVRDTGEVPGHRQMEPHSTTSTRGCLRVTQYVTPHAPATRCHHGQEERRRSRSRNCRPS
jgi:hypothetical protein